MRDPFGPYLWRPEHRTTNHEPTNPVIDTLSQFLDRAFTMPTAVWSVLLILFGLYWLLSLLSGLDLDALDGVADLADAADGLGDAADAADGLADMADAADGLADAADGMEAHPGFFHHIGFGEVPRMITWSLVTVFGWTASFAASIWFPEFSQLAAKGLWAALAIGVGSLVLAIATTAIAIQPLRKVLRVSEGTVRNDLLGTFCVIKTTRVDAGFGQAEAAGGQLVQVRRPEADVAFGYGDKALIYDYDSDREAFLIAPLDADLGRLA